MKIDVLTLFPEMFDGFLSSSIIKRALDKKSVDIKVYNIRDFSKEKNKSVDDYSYGGGNGMVLMCQPIFDAVFSLKKESTKVVMLTPIGEVFKQEKAYEFSHFKHVILICGHYEGFDERIRSIVDIEISIGDFVLTGGEVPAMAIIDSVVRLLPGVIKKQSHINDSFNNNLLDHPVYTKPDDYKGMKVPSVLLSGHHKNIEKWRYDKQVERTKNRRPDIEKN